MTKLPTTIVIPAHNEEAVIVRTLSTLLRDAGQDEFDVIVVCNGCSDRTAGLVRENFRDVTVVELREASKTAAINSGLKLAVETNVVLLDADIEITAGAVRALAAALETPSTEAAIGHMRIDSQGATWPVRAFYRIWSRHPYLQNGKFAAAIALSRTALNRIGQLPPVVADDSFLRRSIPLDRVAVVDAVSFTARVPRTLSALIRVRARVHRGNRELDRLALQRSGFEQERPANLVREVLRHPRLWVDAPWYLLVFIAARIRAAMVKPSWGRDLTSRQAIGHR